MNRVYKVIWCHVRNIYVVASELASVKKRGKSLVSAMVMSTVLGMMPLFSVGSEAPLDPLILDQDSMGYKAENLNKDQIIITIDSSEAAPESLEEILSLLQANILVNRNATQFLNQSTNEDPTTRTISSAWEGIAAYDSTTFKDWADLPGSGSRDAEVFAQGSIAIGRGSQAGQGTDGRHALAIGTGSIATEFATIAMGARAEAFGAGSTAIGYRSTTDGAASVAIGQHSMAEKKNSVAIGSKAKAEG